MLGERVSDKIPHSLEHEEKVLTAICVATTWKFVISFRHKLNRLPFAEKVAPNTTTPLI
jgi:hypothetical protein